MISLLGLLLSVSVLTQADSLVRCSTTRGIIIIEMHPEWSELGVQRFLELVRDDFFTDMLLYRAIPKFLIQFGVAADPAKQAKWNSQRFPDESTKLFPAGSWEHGMLSYAGAGSDSRSCHVFITLANDADGKNHQLGTAKHEAPFAKIIKGLDVITRINFEYGDNTIGDQGEFAEKGNAWMLDKYPNLDRIKRCKVGKRRSEVKKRVDEDSKQGKSGKFKTRRRRGGQKLELGLTKAQLAMLTDEEKHSAQVMHTLRQRFGGETDRESMRAARQQAPPQQPPL